MSMKRIHSVSPPRIPAVRQKPNLHNALDILSNVEHANFDKEVLQDFDHPATPLSSTEAVLLLITVALLSRGTIDEKYTKTSNARLILSENSELHEKLLQAWEAKSFRELRCLDILRSPPPPHPPGVAPHQHEVEAIQKSWEFQYHGGAAGELWDHIAHHFKPNNTRIYAHYTSVVQSSGMGKSRTVDELGKTHFVVPINLGHPGNSGFPAPDHVVRDFLIEASTQAASYSRACCFLEALFERLGETLDNLFKTHRNFPETIVHFRKFMTLGQSMFVQGENRQEFFSEVIVRAKSLLSKSEVINGTVKYHITPPKSQKDYEQCSFPPFVACKRLIQKLSVYHGQEPLNVGTPQDKHPLIILAFDEAHTLTSQHWEGSWSWAHFSELRQVLRALHSFPLFSLFLSTTGKISQFTSREQDNSRRIVNYNLGLIEPFSDLGFDSLAKIVSVSCKLKPEGRVTLEQVTRDDHMVFLGRPLFGTRFKAGNNVTQEEIIIFAASKLLGGEVQQLQSITDDQALACLSQRMPIEFYSIAMTTALKQVESHMRVCLKVDASFESMVTVSASEPILSEAAYYIMSQEFFNSARAMKLLLGGFSIDTGNRGEFVVLLLLTLARDQAVGPPSEFGRPAKRTFLMAPFLYGNLINSSDGLAGDVSKLALKHLSIDFPTAEMHFSHFVKLHDHKAVDKNCLLSLLTRGAGVLCGINFPSVDAINVFTLNKSLISPANFGLILHQMKLDSKVVTYNQKFFDVMDPYTLGILESGDPAVPLIRIFYALASEPSIFVRRREKTSAYGALIYDIWCGGVSQELFSPVKEPDTWSAMLQVSRKWDNIYKTQGRKSNIRRFENPGAAIDSGHWSWVVKD